ncbi:porin [Candidatus Pelagibacter ubique]|nr:porin [Candidatus Pelagibacter ubique]
MNNFKKIGMTALAASLVSTSVFAGEMAVTGSASINYENYKADSTAAAAAKNSTKSFSMGNQLTFSGSGELDNGLSVALSFVLDQGDNADGAAGSAESPFDSHSVTISSDAFGKLQYFGEGGDSAQNAVGDTAAGNIWDTFDGTGRGGGTSELQESNSGTNFLYTLPSMVDGLTVMASYLPAAANDESDTAYALTYAGIDGLSVSYGKGSNDGQAAGLGGSTTNADTTSIKATYAYGPITLAYSDHEFDSNTDTSDQDTTSYKVSYTVSDAISISYGEEEMESGTAGDSDAKYSAISASYTAGGMTISASMKEMENGDYVSNATKDEEFVGLGVSFAF